MTHALETYEELLKSRYSCRAYQKRTVPEDVIKQIVTVAGRVPSSCNAQPWQLAITRPETTEELAAAFHAHVQGAKMDPDVPWPEAYEGLYKERQFECGMQLYAAAGIAREDKRARAEQSLENFRFFGAPHMALVSSPKALGPYGLADCGSFACAFCLAARALGVASIIQAAPAGFAPFLRERLSIAENRDILCAISFGYEDKDAPINGFRTSRASASEIIDWH